MFVCTSTTPADFANGRGGNAEGGGLRSDGSGLPANGADTVGLDASGAVVPRRSPWRAEGTAGWATDVEECPSGGPGGPGGPGDSVYLDAIVIADR